MPTGHVYDLITLKTQVEDFVSCYKVKTPPICLFNRTLFYNKDYTCFFCLLQLTQISFILFLSLCFRYKLLIYYFSCKGLINALLCTEFAKYKRLNTKKMDALILKLNPTHPAQLEANSFLTAKQYMTMHRHYLYITCKPVCNYVCVCLAYDS